MNRSMALVAALLMTLSWPSGASDDSGAMLVQELESASSHGLQGTVRRLIDRLAERSSSPQAELMDHYNLAFGQYRLVGLLMEGREHAGERDDLLEQAQELLERALEMDDEHVESLSLLSAVIGLRIGDSPVRGMRLGPHSSAALGKAARLAPDNPRVVLQRGVSSLHMPKMFGGGIDKAEEALRRAVALFADQADDAPWPNWGRLDALAWLGQTLAKQGRIDEARAAYQQALAIEPDMGWIRYALLPALDAQSDGE